MTRRRGIAQASLALLMLLGACTPPAEIRVDAVQPSSGPVGTSVTVSGRLPVDAVVSLCGVALEDFRVMADERTTLAPGLTVRGAAGSRGTGRVPPVPDAGACAVSVTHAGSTVATSASFVVTDDAPAAPTTVPPAPASFTATPGDRAIELAFALDPSVPVTGVEYRLDDGDWVEAGAVSPVTVTGLVNWRRYELELRAVNEVGAGASASATGMPSLPFTAIDAGSRYTIALDDQGRAWTWGRNLDGQLGDGSTTGRASPGMIEVPANAHGATRFTSVSGGFSHTAALDDRGRAWTWGTGGNGQLGDGAAANSTTPVLVELPANAHGATRFTTLRASDVHTVALDDQGRAWTWGFNADGQLGIGTMTSSTTPVLVELPANGHGGTRFTTIRAGDRHTVAIDDEGYAWTWGWNLYGQLGDGSTTRRMTPVAVALPANAHGATRFVAIDGGDGHTVALDDQGRAWAWGSNGRGQIGDGTTDDRASPVLVEVPANAHGATRFTTIRAGFFHTVAVDDRGHAWTWGWNLYGQLGDGTTTRRSSPVPLELPANERGATRFTAIAGGTGFTVALDDQGHAWSTGDNADGQLGDDTTIERWTVVPVVMPGGHDAPAPSTIDHVPDGFSTHGR